MDTIPYLLLIDIPVVICMLVLAYLSRGLSDYMKLFPFYKLLYGTAAAVGAVILVDFLGGQYAVRPPAPVLPLVRCLCGAVAIGVCLRYWSWTIKEYFNK